MLKKKKMTMLTVCSDISSCRSFRLLFKRPGGLPLYRSLWPASGSAGKETGKKATDTDDERSERTERGRRHRDEVREAPVAAAAAAAVAASLAAAAAACVSASASQAAC